MGTDVTKRRAALNEASAWIADHDREDRRWADALLRGELCETETKAATEFVQGARLRRAELEALERLRRLSLNIALDRECVRAEARNQGTRRAGAGEIATVCPLN